MNLWKWLLVAVGAVAFMAFLIFVPMQAHSQVASITLDWTAPGDDGTVGTASSYQMRWSTTRPDTTSQAAMDSWWNGATSVSGLPVPRISGTAESFSVPGPFLTGRTYYFVMKACDEVPNCSGYSNVAVKFLPDSLPPSPILDLRAR